MNKILPILAAFGLTLAVASAQSHTPQNFLTVRALNTGTNANAITNIANNVGGVSITVNNTNKTTFTNQSGTYIGPTSTAHANAVLFRDIALYHDSLGRPIVWTKYSDGSAAAPGTNTTFLSGQTLNIELVNPNSTNATIGFRFRPIWDGTTANASSTEDWWAVFPASGGTANVPRNHYATNMPTYLWPGAAALRLISITNNTAPAVDQTNSPFVTKIIVNGFRP